MPINLPGLPWRKDALVPHISERTIDYHYGKHHAGYVKKLNKEIEGTPLENENLVAIVQATAGNDTQRSIFNKAAQAWNHTFLWHSMSPEGGGAPQGDVAAAIDESFGSFGGFVDEFLSKGAARFGSGWVWLVHGEKGLSVETTVNAETPLVGPRSPLLTADVWEHAYYLDYQNDRAAYLEVFLEQLVNWEFAETNLASART